MKFRSIALLGCAICASTAVTRPVQALPAFAKAFKTAYFAPSEDEEFRKAIRKANCNICHVKGEKKDVNNEYGEKIAELIEGNAKNRWDDAKKIGEEEGKAELEKLVAELNAALTKVGELKNKEGKTYGEILAAGDLPVPVPVNEEK